MATTAALKQISVRSDEGSLIFASKQGDQDAFNQLVLRYQDRIYNLAVRILGDAETAGDVTQNTFITAYLNLARFRDGSFTSWLYRIATNACYDLYRHHKRHPLLSLEDTQLAEEKLSQLTGFSSSNALPEVELERRELAQTIQHALNQLDINQRAVVILVDQQELDYREAARILGVPVGTVKSRLARARLQLRQLIGHALARQKETQGEISVAPSYRL